MKRKTTVVLGIIIVICAAICGIWLSGRRNGANTQEELHVLIVGDSISEGAGASDPSLKWYKYLIPHVNETYGKDLQITNVSMGGNTSYAGYVRVMQLDEKENYDLVMVCFGENDAEADFAEYYELLLQTIVERWPSCKLVTILESSQREYTAKIQTIQRLSEQYHAYVMDMIAAFDQSGRSYDELCDDGTHPNDEGQKVYYAEAVKVIDRIYGKQWDNSSFHYYAVEDFTQTGACAMELEINGYVNSMGIDYDRIKGYHEIEVMVDGNSLWKYQEDWSYDFTQRHIEVIKKGRQKVDKIIITFSSEEEMKGFHGMILD